MSNAYGAASCACAPEIAANATTNAARAFLIVVFRMRATASPAAPSAAMESLLSCFPYFCASIASEFCAKHGGAMSARHHRTPRTAGLLVIAVLALLSLPARAEVAEITVSKEYGIGYLPYMIMEHQKLVEKHARVSGLGGVKVNWQT